MPDEKSPVDRFARGLEEILRAGADALALWRQRGSAGARRAGGAREQGEEGAAGESLERTLERLERQLSTYLDDGEGRLRTTLCAGLRQEMARWELRSANDPAARRVRDLFAAILDLIDEQREREPRRRRDTRRAPPRQTSR